MIIDFLPEPPKNQRQSHECFLNTLFFNHSFELLSVAESGAIANAAGIGHHVGNGALLHDSGEEVALGAGGKDTHIFASMHAKGAMDVAGMYEV